MGDSQHGEQMATLQAGCATVARSVDGLIIVRFATGARVGEGDARAIVEARRQLLGDRVLVDCRTIRTADRRAFVVSRQEGNPPTRAVALLVSGPVSTTLGNFFLALFRPSYATRVFRAEDQALDWLRHDHR